jgi:3-oxoacyl-[acyl-carrier protein] reductase
MMLQDKVAIVTGGSRGIGRGICLVLAQEGAKVVVNYVAHPLAAQEVVRAIQEIGEHAMAFEADVANAEMVSRMVNASTEHFGRVDILVNNAGIATHALVVEMTEGDWDQVLDVNLKGAFLCSRAVLPHFTNQRSGSIVNIASLVSRMGSYQHAHYAASKAGLLAFTMSLAKEVGQFNIRVNAISPGRIESDMEPERQARERDKWIAETPLGRMGEPQDIGKVVAFLCSDTASFITGETVNVNGGIWMG